MTLQAASLLTFRILPLLLVLISQHAALSLAQSSFSRASSSNGGRGALTSTSSSAAATWTVHVGDGNNAFEPAVVLANVGDIIQFDFYPANHSVVRAEYLQPCIPYEDTGKGKVGFASGFHSVDAILDEPPNWSVRVNDSSPIFYYCSASGSCIDYQMVGVINPGANQSLEEQKRAAKGSAYMLQPGEPFPAEGSSASPAPTSMSNPQFETGPPGSGTSTPAPMSSSSSGSSLGSSAVAGIAIGSAVIALLFLGLVFFIGRTQRLRRQMEHRRMGDRFVPGCESPTNLSPRGNVVAGVPPLGATYQTGSTLFARLQPSNDTRPHPDRAGFVPLPGYDKENRNFPSRAQSPTRVMPQHTAVPTLIIPHPATRAQRATYDPPTASPAPIELYAPMPKSD